LGSPEWNDGWGVKPGGDIGDHDFTTVKPKLPDVVC
jgi:hypothetical protein